MNNKFMKKKEVADFLGYTVYTIDRYVKKKGFPFTEYEMSRDI